MDRGAGKLVVSARSWGRTGLFMAVLASCAAPPAPSSSAPPPPEPVPVVAAEWEAPGGADAPMLEAPITFDGPTPAAAPADIRSGPAADGVWAVVVGIDDYPGGSHDLRSAGRDADAMEAVLAAADVAPDRRLHLRDGQATADVLRRGLDWLVERAGPESTAVFFFAGHVRQMGSGTEALVGADGRLVTDSEVAHRLRDLRASRTWLVLATCYGGGFDEVLAPGRILTAAAPAGQLAYESLAMRRSYLVEYVLHQALLEGQAPTSVEAAFAWGEAAIRREHPRRVPVQFDQLEGELTLGGARPAATTVPPPREIEPASRPRPEGPTTTTTTTTTTTIGTNEDCVFTVGTLLHCPD